MQKDGEEGRKKLTAITRYLTVGLSLFESIAMCIGFGNKLILELNAVNVIVVVASLTAGSAFLMWIGEQINDKGVGNGISMVLLINILSRIPVDMITPVSYTHLDVYKRQDTSSVSLWQPELTEDTEKTKRNPA